MGIHLKKTVIGSLVCVIGVASVALAGNVDVGVDVSTPNVRLQVGTQAPPPPPPRVTVVERERVIVRDGDRRHDRGHHKGHYKKYKKHGKHH